MDADLLRNYRALNRITINSIATRYTIYPIINY